MASSINSTLLSLLQSSGVSVISADNIVIDKDIVVTKYTNRVTVTNNRSCNIDGIIREIGTQKYSSFTEIKDYILSVGHKNIIIFGLDTHNCRSSDLATLFQLTTSKTITYTSW